MIDLIRWENKTMKITRRSHLALAALQIAATLFSLSASGCFPMGAFRTRERVAVRADVTQEYDIPDLNMYGDWVVVAHYGRVWRPSVVEGWRPFYHGHWAYADEGWTWISYEPFGWITYHYGNWYPSPEFGWVWIPGHGTWSPARVQWVQYGDYVGWAPLAPAGVRWGRPWERSQFDVWAVVHTNDIDRDYIGRRRIARADIRFDAEHEKVFDQSPEPRMIEGRVQHKIEKVRINRETVVIGKGEFHKVVVSDRERGRVDKYKASVERDVVKRPNQGEHR